MRGRWVAVLLATFALSCESPVAVPPGAILYAPDPSQFRTWWREVEVCSGLRGDFDRVSFYVVPNVTNFYWDGQAVIGVWLEAGNRIVLAGNHANRAGNVRHEMLHSLLKAPGHPREYFKGACDPLVD